MCGTAYETDDSSCGNQREQRQARHVIRVQQQQTLTENDNKQVEVERKGQDVDDPAGPVTWVRDREEQVVRSGSTENLPARGAEEVRNQRSFFADPAASASIKQR
jgi:hypothetical protein